MGDPHGIGVIGLGAISSHYLSLLTAHPLVRVAAVADLDEARAAAVAAETGAAALEVDALLADSRVDTVLNLTIPAAHADISLRAIAAGKAVYSEKPLAASFDDAKRVVEAGAAGGVAVGGAPDTVLGTGTQTAREAIDAGRIGAPAFATATMIVPGHEHWHPNPDFYYAEGGGPLLDMGPYYISSLVHLLGPVVAVTGASARSRDVRTIGSGPRAGEQVSVTVDTHVTGILEHAGGALSTILMSFDGAATTTPPIEVHGAEGSLSVPDPNTFGGDVVLHRLAGGERVTLPPSAGYAGSSRGIGLVDMLLADQSRAARANGDLALHVLDVMTGLIRSAGEGRRLDVSTSVKRPTLVPLTPREAWLGPE
ncbi:Gfo/Idh/MocA family oxidoreductase [Glycomyces sp. TRM65418]|uniref:Gfo/Idh/MocA family protein n=1 Tax=Glycomyces sp. TRM65418 TaxID=2867006 RepID=UPI001CE55B25|nr:Gfo/Idh/MocA family oxidoreductase [Glycomyces sp. TRM65418]MCC3764227.1 Gfo/Idh/MocA family oxidoreductase [Glycomyces sp. TRM65418]QZD53910.1 Gfo/Idh/MocA family oxidoreductase [Glycomyces sp. TRM65418]